MTVTSEHAELVDRARKWLTGTMRCKIVFTETVTFNVAEQPDAIGWKTEHSSILVECKATREDFQADQRKPHRKVGGMGAKRYYLTPPGLLGPSEIPDGWGLLETDGKRVSIVKQAAINRDMRDKWGLLTEIAYLFALLHRAQYRVAPLKIGEWLHKSFEAQDRRDRTTGQLATECKAQGCTRKVKNGEWCWQHAEMAP